MNLVLVSRSLDKLKDVRQRLQAINNEIETRIIVADLGKGARDIEMYKGIAEQVTDIDLALVINNAGVMYAGEFKEISCEKQREMTIVNTYPYVLLARALLPYLQKRGADGRSTIVNLASSASFFPLPYSAIYSSTKVFDRFFSEALSIELS